MGKEQIYLGVYDFFEFQSGTRLEINTFGKWNAALRHKKHYSARHRATPYLPTTAFDQMHRQSVALTIMSTW